jgi:hypothetical protein
MKTNTDGSLRLGTLSTVALIALAKEQGINTTAIESAMKLVDEAVKELVVVAKRDLNNKVRVRVQPNEPSSNENIEVPFVFETYVSYIKRKNPTRSQSTKAQIAEKAKAEYTHRKNSLVAQLSDLAQDSPEYNKILDQLIAM